MFIVFEGLDGAGTTTQSKLLNDTLINLGHKSFITNQPSTGPIGSMIRNILSGRIITSSLSNEVVSDKTLACLFAADRYDHIQNVIKPMLDKSNVICDRYDLSTLAYQTKTDIEAQWVEELHRYILAPDVTFFIKISAYTAYERIYKSRSILDMHEKQDMMINIAKRYDEIVKKKINNAEHIVILDGNEPISMIHERVFDYLKKYLKY